MNEPWGSAIAMSCEASSASPRKFWHTGTASGNRMQLDLLRTMRRANSLPMTDFLHPWPPPSIRGPFAEVAHEAPYHQRGWQVAPRNRARSRPFCCQESRYSYGPPCGPPCTLLLRDSSKKSVSHFGFGEIIKDRCTNITTRTLSRYLKTESRGTIALRLRTHCRHGNRPSRDLCPQPAQADIGAIDG